MEDGIMIAPCGLDCSLCVAAQRAENPCPGCRRPGEGKSEHCSKLCKILFCAKRQSLENGFCHNCDEFPCSEIRRMEQKYHDDYPMQESLIENLENVRRFGASETARLLASRWSCPHCGGLMCVHTGKCSKCGSEQ